MAPDSWSPGPSPCVLAWLSVLKRRGGADHRRGGEVLQTVGRSGVVGERLARGERGVPGSRIDDVDVAPHRAAPCDVEQPAVVRGGGALPRQPVKIAHLVEGRDGSGHPEDGLDAELRAGGEVIPGHPELVGSSIPDEPPHLTVRGEGEIRPDIPALDLGGVGADADRAGSVRLTGERDRVDPGHLDRRHVRCVAHRPDVARGVDGHPSPGG
ncbi:hypothetical protein ABE10_02135 [Bacillus toyonensis]|nr:hypothetical protein [Bacillus toyonensis]